MIAIKQLDVPHFHNKTWNIIVLLCLLLSPQTVFTTQSKSNSEINVAVNFDLLNELSLGGGAKDIVIEDQVGFVLDDQGLDIYNLSKPEVTTLLGNYPTVGYLGHSMVLWSDHILTANDDQGIRIIDVSDYYSPVLSSTYTSSRPASISNREGLLLVANFDNDFEIYNMSNLPNINEIDRYSGTGYHKSYVFDYRENTFALVFANNYSFDIFNFNNSSKIEIIGSFDFGMTFGCAIVKEYILYVGGPNGLRIMNITDISQPSLYNDYIDDPEAWPSTMAIRNNILYVSDFKLGLRVFDINDPLTPVEIGRYNGSIAPLGLVLDNELVYIASQNRGIQILNITIAENSSNESARSTSILSYTIVIGLLVVVLIDRKQGIRRI